MGGEFGRDLGAVGLGIQEQLNSTLLEQLFNRRQQEEQALRQVSTALADTGQLHLLPEDVQKGIEKRGGKELFQVLSQMSNLRQQEFEPRRQAQRDFLSIINAPVQIPEAAPSATVPVAQPTQAPQIQVTPGDRIARARDVTPRPEATPTAPSTEGPSAAQVVNPIEPDIAPQPMPVQVTQTQRERAATPFERAARIENLSPIGAALAFNDNALGTLQVQQGQIANARNRIALDRSIEAFKRMKPTYASSFEGIDTNGRPTRFALFYMGDGTTHTVPIGRGAGGDRTQRALTALQAIEDKLRDPKITEPQRARLEKDRDRQESAFTASLQSSQQINLPEPLETVVGEGGRFLGTIRAGDEVARRNIQRLELARTIGSNKEIARDRNVLFEGTNALALVDDILAVATPENTGLIGSFRSGAQSLAALAQTAPRAFSSLEQLIGVARNDVRNAESREFTNRLIKAFDASPDFIDATTQALAVVMAKVRDPNSVVRETEYENALSQLRSSGGLFGSGFPGFRVRIEVARRDMIRRMRSSYLSLKNVEGTIQAMQGDPSARIPLVNPNLDLPPEVIEPRFRSNVPGLPEVTPFPGTESARRQQIGAGTIPQQVPAQRMDPVQREVTAVDTQRLIGNILGDFGLQSIPQPLLPELQLFIEENPTASGQAIAGAFQRMINRWATENNVERVR